MGMPLPRSWIAGAIEWLPQGVYPQMTQISQMNALDRIEDPGGVAAIR